MIIELGEPVKRKFIEKIGGFITMNNTYIPEEFTANSEKMLKEICDNAMSRLYHENNLDIRDSSVAWTVWVKVTEEIAKTMGAHPEELIDAASLLRFSVQNRPDEKGEKAGNIVPLVEPGERFKLAVKDDEATEDE
jgi:hypothetical protein